MAEQVRNSREPSVEIEPLGTLDEDYGKAVVHLVWNLHRQTKVRTLLCGAAELLPNEVPPPVERPERCHTVSHEHRVYAISRVVTARQAVSWFEMAAEGRIVRPHPDGRFTPTDPTSPAFAPVTFHEEPPSPTLVTSALLVPFSADWHTSPRVRHLVARQFDPEHLWSAKEFEAARQWMEEDMNFDWPTFPEYYGSLHLIAPNPVFRALHGRISRTDNHSEFVVALELRAGKNLDGLEYEIESRRPTGTAFIVRQPLRNVIQHISIPCPPEETYERIHDAKRGLIYSFGPFVCGVTLSGTVNLVAETRRVSIPHTDGTVEHYETPLTGSMSVGLQVGTPQSERDGYIRLSTAQEARRRVARGKDEQKWFRDSVRDATDALRSLVRKTSPMLMIVDPYFEGDDLHRIVLAIGDPETHIRVLVGANHLRSWHTSEKQKRHHDHLAAQLHAAVSAGRMNPIEIRVMEGAVPAIHDRFILVGRDLWALGSSLNAYGSRGTLLLKVPDPEPVLRDIQRVWDISIELVSWRMSRTRPSTATDANG